MTFEELDAAYPNGFDDAEIDRLILDYRNRTVELQLRLRGTPRTIRIATNISRPFCCCEASTTL